MSEENISFEEALKELETIVEKLENNKMSLNEGLESYEKGVRLVKKCNEILTKAELKLEEIMAETEDSENFQKT